MPNTLFCKSFRTEETFHLSVLGTLAYGVDRKGKALPIYQLAGPNERLSRNSAIEGYLGGYGYVRIIGEVF